MFENISEGLFMLGASGYLYIVPVLRFFATLLMLISTYKVLKVRQDSHKGQWLLGVIVFPILGRIAYEIYRRYMEKKEHPKVKGSTSLMVVSLFIRFIAVILLVSSFISMGAGFIRGEITGEWVSTYYDLKGNQYSDVYDVPFYDKEGNRYTYEPEWFTSGTYTDQKGNKLDGDYAYIDENGYFYYDKNNTLKPHNDSYDYYTDGENLYYSLFFHVYWEENGEMYAFGSKYDYKLFDFDE
ncbi:MAG: hypothetical protein IIU80_02910 [Clostridia bacterium]|nr:hypothetical protein [Clostridia bacterium]